MLDQAKAGTRRWLRSKTWWLDFQHSRRQGWRLTCAQMLRWPLILKTRPLVSDSVREGATVESHIFCGRRDWLGALWTVKSMYFYAQVRYPLVVHLYTALNARSLGKLRHHLPNARIVPMAEADQLAEAYFREHDLLLTLACRRANAFVSKLTDFQLFAGGKNILGLDADVLFFRRPGELVVTGDQPLEKQYFQRDAFDNYNGLTYEQARRELGVELVPLINVGITLRARHHVDLRRVEAFMGHPVAGRPQGSHTEQAVHALCASEQGNVRFLPDAYCIWLGAERDCDQLICRHYCGPSRAWLTYEGMPYLKRRGFLDQR
jgi:hypothetical protein